MKKYMLIISCLLFILITAAHSQNSITREEAYQALLKKGLVNTLKNNVEAAKQIISSETPLNFMGDTIKSPIWNSWFFLIDLHPSQDWGHPCKYVFVNSVDTSIIVIDGQLGASFPTDILLFQKSRDNTPEHIFLNEPQPLDSTTSNIPSKVLINRSLTGRNYAILLNGGYDKENNNLRYWNNISLVYKTLMKKKWDPEKIWVLSADGTNNGDDCNIIDTNNDDDTTNITFDTQNLDLDRALDKDAHYANDITNSATKHDIPRSS